ncbi:MAG: N-acetyltransferase [Eubacteriales bacterium]
MQDIYDKCPTYFSSTVTIRALDEFDAAGLLEVYSDEKAVPFFNSDNCDGDDFHYTDIKRMQKAVAFWQQSYKNGDFVRFAVTDNITNDIIGTLEMFNRGPLSAIEAAGDELAAEELSAADHGVLRIDLRSSYERADVVRELLAVIADSFYTAFDVRYILTKAIPQASERIKALEESGYRPFGGRLGGKFEHYYIRRKI